MNRKFRNLLASVLSVLMLVTHLNVVYLHAEDITEGIGEVPVIEETDKTGHFHSPLIGEFDENEESEPVQDVIYEDTDMVRVSIVLKGDSALERGYDMEGIGSNSRAIGYRNALRKRQDKLAGKISSRVLNGEKLNVVWNHTLAANIMSAYVPYGKIEEIKKISGVKDVFIENMYTAATAETGEASPNMISSREMTQTNGENASEYSGQGSRIAIIDTGLDIEHISFDADAFMHAAEEGGFTDQLMTEADVQAVAASLNVEGAYLNEKVPYYYNYVDRNLDLTHVNDTEGNHGSHVAGIAAANRYIKETDSSYVDAGEKFFVTGQAPDAQIFVMKVFGQGGGAYDSDYFAAIEDAIVLGADSVNLSLGSTVPGYVYAANEYQDILNSLSEKGTVIVFSAGNNSSWDQQAQLYAEDINYSAGGTPGTYLNTLSVASADNDGYTGVTLDISGDKIPFNENGDYSNAPITSIAGEHQYIYVDSIGVDADGASLFKQIRNLCDGKVIACNRGTSNFAAKANAAVEAGGIATIIVNNQPGTISMQLSDYIYTAPAVSITQSDGEYLKDNATETGTYEIDKTKYTYYIGKITIGEGVEQVSYNSETYAMSDFSSWGVPGALILKPEITAPGGNIYSLNGYSKVKNNNNQIVEAGGHDQFTLMSGTSMAAPQISGIIALVGQYYRENDIAGKTGLTLRQFAQSLLMSTATPLIDDYGYYYPVLQQGAGMANVEAAVSARSFIHMSEDDESLTAMTGSAADYKVKAELGDDAKRTGSYEYTFEITNFGDETIKYTLSTDLFTQDKEEYEGLEYLDPWTINIAGDVTYNIVIDATGHDVDKDGDTDSDDAQAILDYVTGKKDGAELDLKAGKLDEDDEVTSRDSYLLLMFLEASGIGKDWFYLHDGDTATVTVSIDVSGSILEDRKNGGYVEGFTYVKGDKDVKHSIPVLAYYGSWSDPSMYDAVTYEEQAMGSSDKVSYFNAKDTNGYQLKYKDGRNAWFTGNPYVAEPDIDEERFAINSSTIIKNARFTLIRNGIGRIIAVKDAEGNIVKTEGFSGGKVIGAYYNSQKEDPSWEYTNSNVQKFNLSARDLGFEEGDKFSISLYNVPEYYGLLANKGNNNTITEAQLLEYINAGEIGKGAELGYTFTVDDTAPEIISYEMSEDKSTITVTAKDDRYIAFIGLTDIQGNEVFIYEIPEQSAAGEEVSVTLDVTGKLPNAAALIVGDYARNEDVKLARFAEGPVVTKKVLYVLTDELNPDSEYIIADSNVAGKANAINSNGVNYYVGGRTVEIVNDGTIPAYITADSAEDSFVWYTYEGIMFQNKGDEGVLGYNALGRPMANWGNADYADGFAYTEDHKIIFNPEYYGQEFYDRMVTEENEYKGDLGISQFISDYFWFGIPFTSGLYLVPGDLYLYERVEITEEVYPEEVSSITINPSPVTLIMDVKEEQQLTATVAPITVEDKTVTWTSSDPTIATVDENGMVKAVSVGEVTVTATSNQTPDFSESIPVSVVKATPLNAYIYGQVASEGSIEYDMIDLTDMTTYKLGDADEILNGGRSGSYFYGINSDNLIRRFNLADFSEDTGFARQIEEQFAMIDGADIWGWTANDGTLNYPYVAAGIAANNTPVFYTDTTLWYLDASDLESIVAMALVDFDDSDPEDPTFYYALLSDQGTLYLYMVYGIVQDNGTVDVEGKAYELGHVDGISFSDDITQYSMTCAFGHFLDENYESDYSKKGLFVADNTINGIYYIDLNEIMASGTTKATFVGVVEGARNVSALFNDFYDSLAAEEGEAGSSLIREFVEGHEIISESQGQMVELKAEESTPAEETETAVEEPSAEIPTVEEAPAEVPAEETVAEEPSAEETPVEEAPAEGTLNALRTMQSNGSRIRREETPAEKEAEEEGEETADDTVTVTVTEKDLTNNGYYVISYDPDVLEYVSTEYDKESEDDKKFYSVNDTEAGEIRFAFADVEGFEGGSSIATVTFKKGCEDTVITTETVENNDQLGLSEKTETEVEGTGHAWSEPEWTWSSDHSSATAKFSCENNEEHVQEITEKSVVTTTPATADKDGKKVYKVTVVGPDGKEYSVEFTEIIPAGVNTGDRNNLTVWYALLGGSVVVIVGILLFLKKKKDNQ